MTKEMLPGPLVPVENEVVLNHGYDMFLDYDNFEEAQRRAKALAECGFIPDRYKNNVANVLVGLNLARKLNTDPLTLLQNTYFVHGQVGFTGKFIHALLNRCGRFSPLDFDYQIDQRSGEVVSCTCKATDLRLDKMVHYTLTWKDIEKAGWNRDKKDRNGNILKSPWNVHRKLMFTYRVVAHFAKTFAPDIIMGLQSWEEIRDIERNTKPIKKVKIITNEPTPQEPWEFEPQPPPPLTQKDMESLLENDPFLNETEEEYNKRMDAVDEQATSTTVENWWDDMNHWQYRKSLEFYLIVMIGFGIAFRSHRAECGNGYVEMGEGEQKKYFELTKSNPNAILSLHDASPEIKERVERKFVEVCGYSRSAFIDFQNNA